MTYDREVKIEGLLPNQKYRFGIAARNENGTGSLCTPVELCTLERSKRKFQRKSSERNLGAQSKPALEGINQDDAKSAIEPNVAETKMETKEALDNLSDKPCLGETEQANSVKLQ